MKTIQEATHAFLFHCQFEKKLSDKTLKAYSTDLSQFLKFLGVGKLKRPVAEIDKHVLKDFLHQYHAVKSKTLKRKVATLKAMFNFLEFEDEIAVSPFRKLKIKIKEPRVLPSVMSIPEVQKMMNVALAQKRNVTNKSSFAYFEKIRDLAVLEVLFATGARVSELCHLKLQDLNLETGQVMIMGKGSRQRIIQVCHPDTLRTLRSYHTHAQKHFRNAGYFFLNRFGNRLSDQSVRFMIGRYSLRAGINKKITPHTFRHTFATLLLEQNVDIKYIQSFLGHSSISTTQIYTHVNSAKQKEILATRHPRQFIRSVG